METRVKLRSTNEVEGKWVKNRNSDWKKKKTWLQTARPVSRRAEMPEWFEKLFFFPLTF